MPVTPPIRLGSATGSALVPDAQSRIITDDYGVQHGTVHYNLGDQSLAQSSRVALGTSYVGTLPQFGGFFVEKSGDLVGEQGQCASLDLTYARIDPLWNVEPKLSFDIEQKQLQIGNLPTALGFMDSLYSLIISIPHPVVKLKFGSAFRPLQTGAYGTPLGAPNVGTYTFRVDQFRIQSAFLTSNPPIVPGGVYLAIDPNNLTCSETLITSPTQLGGTFTAANPNPSDALNISFTPDSNGWFCQGEESEQICNGQIYLIEQSWIRRYFFSSLSGGVVWQGTCIL